MPIVIGGRPSRPPRSGKAGNSSVPKPLLIALVGLAALALVLYGARALFFAPAPTDNSTLVRDPIGPAAAQPSGPSAGTTLGVESKDTGVVEPVRPPEPTSGKESGAGHETPGG